MTSIVTTDYVTGTTTTETVDYDAIGNPTSYRGATLAFNGRQLTSYNDGTNAISYTYDASGLRASKTINGETTIYQYVGDKLYYEARPDGSKMYYFYDSYGKLAKIYRHTSLGQKVYNVVTNAQGDVTAIYDFYGVLVCTYEYDAWGNLTFARDSAGNVITSQNHIAFLNPIRYRGYYYDSEIGMYYLQSRYYDPDTGRFINADGYITTGQGVLSYNMFAYCLNNPVMLSDPSGYESISERFSKNWDAVADGFRKAVDSIRDSVIDFSNTIKSSVNRVIKKFTDRLVICYEVPLYNQGDKPLCWACCQIMVEDFYLGVVDSEKNVETRMEALGYSVLGDNIEVGGLPTNIGTRYSHQVVNRFLLYALLSDGPLYALYHNGQTGHLVVVTGIDMKNGIVYTNNPWGLYGSQTIDEFKQGFYGMSDTNVMPLSAVYTIKNRGG